MKSSCLLDVEIMNWKKTVVTILTVLISQPAPFLWAQNYSYNNQDSVRPSYGASAPSITPTQLTYDGITYNVIKKSATNGPTITTYTNAATGKPAFTITTAAPLTSSSFASNASGASQTGATIISPVEDAQSTTPLYPNFPYTSPNMLYVNRIMDDINFTGDTMNNPGKLADTLRQLPSSILQSIDLAFKQNPGGNMKNLQLASLIMNDASANNSGKIVTDLASVGIGAPPVTASNNPSTNQTQTTAPTLTPAGSALVASLANNPAFYAIGGQTGPNINFLNAIAGNPSATKALTDIMQGIPTGAYSAQGAVTGEPASTQFVHNLGGIVGGLDLNGTNALLALFSYARDPISERGLSQLLQDPTFSVADLAQAARTLNYMGANATPDTMPTKNYAPTTGPFANLTRRTLLNMPFTLPPGFNPALTGFAQQIMDPKTQANFVQIVSGLPQNVSSALAAVIQRLTPAGVQNLLAAMGMTTNQQVDRQTYTKNFVQSLNEFVNLWNQYGLQSGVVSLVASRIGALSQSQIIAAFNNPQQLPATLGIPYPQPQYPTTGIPLNSSGASSSQQGLSPNSPIFSAFPRNSVGSAFVTSLMSNLQFGGAGTQNLLAANTLIGQGRLDPKTFYNKFVRFMQANGGSGAVAQIASQLDNMNSNQFSTQFGLPSH